MGDKADKFRKSMKFFREVYRKRLMWMIAANHHVMYINTAKQRRTGGWSHEDRIERRAKLMAKKWQAERRRKTTTR